MEKIAILTLYYNNANYGGLLQAYALQKVISEMGYTCHQISYDLNSGYSSLNEDKVGKKEKFIILINRIKNFVWRKHYKRYSTVLKKFERSIPHTVLVNASNIGELLNKYDVFICGSDQIWNPIGWQPNLFLDFAIGKKKVSYAASIARDTLSISEIEYIQRYVKSFSAISVRETITAELLNKSMTECAVEVMPDPTILLATKDWKKIAIVNGEREKRIGNKPYIFAYFLGDDLKQRNKCIKYAQKKGMIIYFIPYMNSKIFIWESTHKKYMLNYVSVNEFLYLIKNAEMVLTDSFHGTVFASIFKTSFYVLNRSLGSNIQSMNSRIMTLLNELELENRYIKDIYTIQDYKYSERELQNISINLERLRQVGIEFLKNVLV